MKMSMREFFEPFREELLQQGIEQGMQQGMQQGKIQGAIMAMLDLGISDEVILEKISKRFAISKEQAQAELVNLQVHA